jgi:hypothetical protein
MELLAHINTPLQVKKVLKIHQKIKLFAFILYKARVLKDKIVILPILL